MKLGVRRALLGAVACAAIVLAYSSTPTLDPLASEQRTAAPIPSSSTPSDGARWLGATRAALDTARDVPLPYAGSGQLAGGGDAATAFAFEALGGQVLEVELDRPAMWPTIYVEVFRVVDVLGLALHERLSALRPSATSLRTRLPSDGTYHVLVQAGAGETGFYRLTLELGAALPFPVVGAEPDAIRSLFGASRDSGRRYHEGVDIFVQRLTPVLAVAAGRAMPRQDALGGNTVWLNTPGTSYYYAHLDRVAVRDQQRVKVGDVLGYVGNTGNATGTPAHLHFGVYRWGREPIDPLPLLVGRRFAPEPATELALDAGG